LIDFEYAWFGTCLFDLAGVASNAGMDGDQARELTRAYLGRDPEPGFARAFDAMAATSLLREAMWAMVSDLHLSAPGADYQAYARDNLAKLDASLATFTDKHGAL
jgi:thiamine kinase-like enzyme